MTQVNFYTLSSEEEVSKLQFACRLCEKAIALGHRVFIQVVDDTDCKIVDDLLWQFKAASFLPHAIVGAESDDTVPILIGSGDCPADASDVLINLRSEACQQHQQFGRINEIITADEASLAAGRDSYRFYQSQGYQPETHKL
ncbi:MAG: DNA polymerase III subunit chi [Pseudomonadales bacterium]|nr:DNA polymerase III subunit chi [Pseudomonadales bacterium]